MIAFGAFRLDLEEERLWSGTKLLALRRKPFAILRYLVANPRRLVSHEQILEAVWGGTTVSDSAVRTHLHELRQVLARGCPCHSCPPGELRRGQRPPVEKGGQHVGAHGGGFGRKYDRRFVRTRHSR